MYLNHTEIKSMGLKLQQPNLEEKTPSSKTLYNLLLTFQVAYHKEYFTQLLSKYLTLFFSSSSFFRALIYLSTSPLPILAETFIKLLSLS